MSRNLPPEPASAGADHLPPAERQWRAALALAWPAGLGLAPLMLQWRPLPPCGFLQLTGLPCPLCGGTHACAALAQGDWAAAWQHNPGVLPVLGLAAAHTLLLGMEAWRGRRLQSWRIGPRAWQLALGWLTLAWVLRLAGWF